MKSRRGFIRDVALGGGTILTVGGLGLLGACDEPEQLTPNAYTFYPVLEGSSSVLGVARDRTLKLKDGSSALHFQGDPLLANDGLVIFRALDDKGTSGLYQLKVDLSATPPKASSPEAIVKLGDTVDGALVKSITSADLEPQGTLVLSLRTQVKDKFSEETIYTYKGGKLSALVKPRAATKEGHLLSGIINDVAVHGTTVTFGSRYLHQDSATKSHSTSVGLFAVDSGGKSPPRLLMRAGDLPLGTAYPVRGFGLVDVHGNNYLVQAFVGDGSANGDLNVQYGALIKGQLNSSLGSVIAVEQPLKAAAKAGTTVGGRIQAPRLNGSAHAFLSHNEDGRSSCHMTTQTLTSTRLTSPSGGQVGLMGPAVAGADGAWYQLQTTLGGDDGDFYGIFREVVRHDASGKQVLLLASGHTLAGDTRPVWDMHFGNMTQQVDKSGRLALVALFSDDDEKTEQATNQAALVIGIPV